MIEYVEKEFFDLVDDGDSHFDGIRFRRCLFDFCAISVNRDDVAKRTHVKNIELIECRTQNHTHIGPAILEDVLVEGLETKGLLILWDPLFQHVTLKGRIGELKINPVVDFNVYTRPSIQVPFDQYKKDYYQNVDWALDISEGVFEDMTIEGVPSHLVRRDPKTQMVVKREKAIQQGWRDKVIPSAKSWIIAIDMLLDDSRESPEMIVPASASKGVIKQEMLDGLQNLRDLGIAEPD